MRIGLVLDRFDPRRGGVEQWTYQFSHCLLEAGHEVHVVAGGFGPQAGELPLICHTLPAVRTRTEQAEAAEVVLRELPLDVIHDMGLGWYCDIFQPHGGSRTASFRQNLLLVPRGLRPAKRLAAAVLPRYQEFAALNRRQYARDGRIVLALSKMVWQDLAADYRFPAEQMRLIYNGVDCARFSPEHRSFFREPTRQRMGVGNETLFLIVAHNLKLKGVPSLLYALQRLRQQRRPVHLAVVGGKRLGWCRRMLRRLELGDCVSFLGPQDDPVPFYAAADVYVQPTYYDPCSLVVLEAMASGLPTITTGFNGAGELMTQGQEGVVVSHPEALGELTDAMAACCDERARARMGRAARELALQHTFERNVAQILDVYTEVAGRRQRIAA